MKEIFDIQEYITSDANEDAKRHLSYPFFKFAELNNKEDLNLIIKKISEKTKEVKEEIYKLLVEEFGYFE